MQMVKIQIRGERGSKVLHEMSRRGSAFRISDNVYLVPNSTLNVLEKLRANFRELTADGYPKMSMTDEMIEGLEKHCGKLVVQKVGQSESIATEHLGHPK